MIKSLNRLHLLRHIQQDVRAQDIVDCEAERVAEAEIDVRLRR